MKNNIEEYPIMDIAVSSFVNFFRDHSNMMHRIASSTWMTEGKNPEPESTNGL